MIQVGNVSVWIVDGVIRCESYTGDAEGSRLVKQKLISVSPVSTNRFDLHTNKGQGYIQFNDSSAENYTVELVLPKFFGKHRYCGVASRGQVRETIDQLKSLHQSATENR